jgi:hypothetical protein
MGALRKRLLFTIATLNGRPDPLARRRSAPGRADKIAASGAFAREGDARWPCAVSFHSG